MRTSWLKTALGFFIAGSLYAADAETVAVTITVNNIRNEEGEILLSVFAGPDGFPGDAEKAYKLGRRPSATGNVVLKIELPEGTYAFSVLHDENSNETMDTTWYGRPREGFGISNNPTIRRRPPGYEESQITVSRERNRFTVNLVYH